MKNKLIVLIGAVILYAYALPGIMRVNNATVESSLNEVARVAGLAHDSLLAGLGK
jgi:hypothetical protein